MPFNVVELSNKSQNFKASFWFANSASPISPRCRWLFNRHQTSVLDDPRIRNGSYAMFWSHRAIRRLCDANNMYSRIVQRMSSVLNSYLSIAGSSTKKRLEMSRKFACARVLRPSWVSCSSISRACLFQHLSLGSRPFEKHGAMFFSMQN